MNDIDRKADALERLMRGNCTQKGHRWVKQKGKEGRLVCIRCGHEVVLPSAVPKEPPNV